MNDVLLAIYSLFMHVVTAGENITRKLHTQMKSNEVLNSQRRYDGTGEMPLALRVEPRCGVASSKPVRKGS